MTYYINPIWFYLMDVGDTLKDLLLIVGITIGMVVGAAYIITYIDNCDRLSKRDDSEDITLLKSLKRIVVVCIITIIIGILVPSKEICIEMMVASQVTHENVTATKEEIYEIVDYITDKVKGEEE